MKPFFCSFNNIKKHLFLFVRSKWMVPIEIEFWLIFSVFFPFFYYYNLIVKTDQKLWIVSWYLQMGIRCFGTCLIWFSYSNCRARIPNHSRVPRITIKSVKMRPLFQVLFVTSCIFKYIAYFFILSLNRCFKSSIALYLFKASINRNSVEKMNSVAAEWFFNLTSARAFLWTDYPSHILIKSKFIFLLNFCIQSYRKF